LQLTNGIFLIYIQNILDKAIIEVLMKGAPLAPYFVNVPIPLFFEFFKFLRGNKFDHQSYSIIHISLSCLSDLIGALLLWLTQMKVIEILERLHKTFFCLEKKC
jgi:hypothetical protein